jgi:O-antigen ligase
MMTQRRPARSSPHGSSGMVGQAAYPWPADRSTMPSIVRMLTFALLVASSDLFLVNNRVSLQTESGGNLVGIRDLLVAMLLVLGFFGAPLPIWSRLLGRSPYLNLCKVVLFLTCIAGALGLYNSGPPLFVAQEFVTMFAWALPLAVAPVLCHPRHLSKLTWAVKYLGLLISIGVFAEIYFGMQIKFVTSHDVRGQMRPTPTCWPLIMLSATVVMVELFDSAPSSLKAKLTNLTIGFVTIVACFLTQSRTLFVGLAAGALFYFLATVLRGKRGIRTGWLLLSVGMLPLIWLSVAMAGEKLIRTDFVSYITARFSVFGDAESVAKYEQGDSRRREMEFALENAYRSPVLGIGLGVPYRDKLYTDIAIGSPGADAAVMVHNIYGHFIVKYGIIGLLAFLIFNLLVLRSLVRAVRDESSMGRIGTILCVGLVNLIACASFGNVFGMPYMVQVAMVWLGGLVAYEAVVALPAPVLVRPCISRHEAAAAPSQVIAAK